MPSKHSIRSNDAEHRNNSRRNEPAVQTNNTIPDQRASTAQLRQLQAMIGDSAHMAAQRQTGNMMNAASRPLASGPRTGAMQDTAPLQAVWKNSAMQGGTLEWDAVIQKLKWHYDTAADRYFYTMDSDSSFRGLDPAVYEKLMDDQFVLLAHDDVRVPPQVVVAPAGDVAETHMTDPLARDCLRALSKEDHTIVMPALAAEIKSGKPTSQGLEDMAKGVLRETKAFVHAKGWRWNEAGNKWGDGATTYVTCDDAMGIYRSSGGGAQEFLDECRRAIFKQSGGRMEDEAGFPKADPDWAVDIQREVINVGGIFLHFTKRTSDKDSTAMGEQTARLTELIRAADAGEWAMNIINGLGLTLTSALSTLEATTVKVPNVGRQHEVADDLTNDETALRVLPLCIATQKRWAAALNGNIHIVVDRANLQGVDGSSTFNAGATPENLMADTGKGLDIGQRISINLDAAPLSQAMLTIAHEMGHAIGFNPTGIDGHGHFKDLRRYKEAEKDLGPKLLYDAYFFETMVKFLG